MKVLRTQIQEVVDAEGRPGYAKWLQSYPMILNEKMRNVNIVFTIFLQLTGEDIVNRNGDSSSNGSHIKEVEARMQLGTPTSLYFPLCQVPNATGLP